MPFYVLSTASGSSPGKADRQDIIFERFVDKGVCRIGFYLQALFYLGREL